MGNLYILRHGNTFDKTDTPRRVGCRTDLPLSSSGQTQAHTTAQGFAAQAISFGRIVCSPLLRTRQTAEAVTAAQPSPPPITFLPFLREVDYGPDENQPEDQVIARLGEHALHLWDTQSITPPGWIVDPEALHQGWKNLIAEAAATEANTLAVTSNGIARFVLPLVNLGATPPATLKLGTCCYGVISCTAAGAQLVSWNQKFS